MPRQVAVAVKVGPKYRVVIPKEVRAHKLWVKPGSIVSVKSLSMSGVKIEPVKPKIETESWVEGAYGINRDIRTDIDATERIRRMRDQEWD